MGFLQPDKVRVEHGLEIKEKIIPWGAKWTKNYGSFKKGDLYKADRLLSGGTGKVQKITIHNTDDIVEAKGTNDAEQYTRATYPNQNMGDSRVHYFIDETDCWQNLREDEVGWHAGDSRGPGNDTTLAIEIIMKGDGSKADIEAEDRGALLTAILLDRHKLTIDDVVTHKHWSGKNCPIYILPHWDEFIAKVKKHLGMIQNPKVETKIEYRVYLKVGAYSTNDEADRVVANLKAASLDACVVSAKNEVVVEKEESKDESKEEPVVKKTNAEIAKEIYYGKCSDPRWASWGSGSTRVERLKLAGYDPAAIQKEVNKLF